MNRDDLALPLAALAMLMSLSALAVSCTAKNHAPPRTVLEPRATPTSVTTTTPTPAPSMSTGVSEQDLQGNTEDPASSPDTDSALRPVEPSATYAALYEAQELRLAPPKGCSSEWYVDLDEPRVRSDSTGAEITYQDCDGAPSLVFGDSAVAVVRSPDASARDCVEAIRTSPAPAAMTPSRNLTVCTVTDGRGGVGEPARARLARLTVTNVNSDDSLNVVVTSWLVPD